MSLFYCTKSFKFAFVIYLWTLQIECDALLLKCPLFQMHLQKIVGFRPPLEYLSERNLIYAPRNNYKDRNRITNRSGYTAISNDENANNEVMAPPPSSICWHICNDDPDCIAYVHLLDTNECFGYSFFARAQQYLAIDNELPLVADPEAIFYEKTCLKVPEACKSRLWALTKIPGTSLVFQGRKTITTLVTRRECAEKCFFESEFKCLSASFAPSYRNNRERFIVHTPPNQQHMRLGRCMLSDKDKMLQPDAFRAAPYDEEYIENQCYERPIENDNCAYELYANSSFIYAEAKYLGLTQKECQSHCSHEMKFYCQGVSFYYEGNSMRSECLLHSEDIISMGPRSLKLRVDSVYMRRVKCLDVQVLCTRDEMSIKYKPKDWFNGKMYASMHSKECIVRGNGTESTVLRLTIGSEAKENRCGVLRAYEVTRDYQRTFISALVVIQNNANVQTQGDRLIKVGCIMSNSTTYRVDVVKDDKDDDDEQIPNAIALESSLEYTQNVLPNEGALHFNSTDSQMLPKITLQIIDLSHQHETNDVQIGQNLELQIVAEYTPFQKRQEQLTTIQLPPLPDFRATSLIAKTQDTQNYVLLIDERGCPTDVSVFPALTRLRTHSKNILYARFHAFKFSGTANVNFDVKTHFCANRCPETNCLEYGSASLKRANRRKRQMQETVESPIKIQNPVYISTVLDVLDDRGANGTTNRTSALRAHANMTDPDMNSVPLNYNLRVHGPDQINSNSYMYGERGVLLIAGIDDQLHLDNICLNQSLLIAVFIFWLIFQVALLFGCCYVLQKYKRLANMEEDRRRIHEEYLEARRVHWADQGGYTL